MPVYVEKRPCSKVTNKLELMKGGSGRPLFDGVDHRGHVQLAQLVEGARHGEQLAHHRVAERDHKGTLARLRVGAVAIDLDTVGVAQQLLEQRPAESSEHLVDNDKS